MSSCAKFHNDSFVGCIVSSKNVKRMSLLSEPFLDNVSKILFYGDMVNSGIYHCVEFHDCRPSIYEESQRNHRSGCIRVLLTMLNWSSIRAVLSSSHTLRTKNNYPH